MARPELSDEQWNKLSENLKKQKEERAEFEKKNPRNYLLTYNEGEFNNHQVVIVTLENISGKQKYIAPRQSQMAMRTQYYWINEINTYLEKDLVQDRLVIQEDYEELFLNEEMYLVNKKLL